MLGFRVKRVFPKVIMRLKLWISFLIFAKILIISAADEKCGCSPEGGAVPFIERDSTLHAPYKNDKYTRLSQAVYNYHKGEKRLPSRMYSMLEKPGRGYWDHRQNRGQPGKDGLNNREKAVFAHDLPEVILKNLRKGTQIPAWAPNPKNLYLNGFVETGVGTPDSMTFYPTFNENFKGEKIVGICPSPKDPVKEAPRFSKGHAVLIYCSEWFSEWDGENPTGKEAVFNNRPISVYYGRTFGCVPQIAPIIVVMVRPETKLGKYFDWNTYKADGPYDYPLLFFVMNCSINKVEILGTLTPAGEPIKIIR